MIIVVGAFYVIVKTDCETDGSFYSTSFNQEFYLKATCCCVPKIAFKSDRSIGRSWLKLKIIFLASLCCSCTGENFNQKGVDKKVIYIWKDIL